jgi:hypothetical protein
MILADILFLLLVIGLGGFGIGLLINKYRKSKSANQMMFEDVRNALFSNDRFAIENVVILYGDRLNKRTREELKHRAVTLEFESDLHKTEPTNPDIKAARIKKQQETRQ